MWIAANGTNKLRISYDFSHSQIVVRPWHSNAYIGWVKKKIEWAMYAICMFVECTFQEKTRQITTTKIKLPASIQFNNAHFWYKTGLIANITMELYYTVIYVSCFSLHITTYPLLTYWIYRVSQNETSSRKSRMFFQLPTKVLPYEKKRENFGNGLKHVLFERETPVWFF